MNPDEDGLVDTKKVNPFCIVQEAPVWAGKHREIAFCARGVVTVLSSGREKILLRKGGGPPRPARGKNVGLICHGGNVLGLSMKHVYVDCIWKRVSVMLT